VTTERSLRSIVSHTVVLLVVVFSSACAQDLDAYRPQIDALLADGAVAAIELGGRWRSVEPTEQQPWPDDGAMYLLIGARADARNGYAVIDEAAQQVVGLVCPVPVPPVPMDVMPLEQAEQVARQFAERHLPELFADGGEVVVTVAEAITLATTSIGQEGLDFHLYCHSICHWNLPSNPVDLEQREGRVNRYKCHAIRRSVARDLTLEALTDARDADPWRSLFAAAQSRRHSDQTDLVPWWVYESPTAVRIQRHVPMLPLSRETQRLPALKRALAAYRMVFGQPRQDDLLEYILARLDESVDLDALRDCQIDLTPP